jgi:colicin V production protein
MGLDVILGASVLISALRGWFKGFVMQAVRLGGLVASVYEARPVRDFLKPYVEGYLRGIRPDLLDRLLWWAACITSYVVTVGLATWLVRIYRRKPYGEPDLYRGNQSAGFLFGAAKGLLLAMLMAAGIDHYILERLKGVGWVEQQAASSHALAWTQKYHPVARLWGTRPVQNFVGYVQQMGLNPPGEAATTPESVRTASRANPLELPRAGTSSTSDDLEDLNAAIDALKSELQGKKVEPN